ncbi:cyclase [Nocardia tenerifensis]|uniref:Cyclase n=1 Tax=Nocardia tenerifensis TaxID=228006 RepID=A0A318KB46_9NOCA|nr:MBL fold metallo-hydrolase [Nocardia tenerifensis]PXX71558.1 cyclase [Nocardia tenerifensis]
MTEIVEIADGVLVASPRAAAPGTSNSTLLLRYGSATVVDTMLVPSLATVLVAELARRRTTARIVVNTHPHIDHVGGNAAFADALIVADPTTAHSVARMATQKSLFMRLYPEHADEFARMEIVPPDGRTAGLMPRFDGCEVLFAGPAHTPGDLAVWVPDTRTLIAGDLCFNEVTPLALPGHASIAGWIAALDRLLALDPVAVVPGHGPAGSSAVLESTRAYLVAVRTVAAAAAQEGIDIAAAADDAAFAPFADWSQGRRTELNLRVAFAELTGDTSVLPAGIPAASGGGRRP